MDEPDDRLDDRLIHKKEDWAREKRGLNGYSTNVPLSILNDADVLIAHRWNDQPLAREHGGPARMIVPRLYAWKGAKWIKQIEFLAEDRLGFWEVRGYSNTADPWTEDRYS